jgi:hypothetical protein
MQTSALRENLATVRSELKSAQEKLVNFEKVKSEKAGLLDSNESVLCLNTAILSHRPRSLAGF